MGSAGWVQPRICDIFKFWTFHAQTWTSFSQKVRGSGTRGLDPLGSNWQAWGLCSPPCLKILHSAPPGLPEPCRLPIRGRCWHVQGTEGGDLPKPSWPGPSHSGMNPPTHRPCSLSQGLWAPGALGMEMRLTVLSRRLGTRPLPRAKPRRQSLLWLGSTESNSRPRPREELRHFQALLPYPEGAP